MTVIRSITAAAILAAGLTAAVPAGAVITTFANYSGVGGANLYWKSVGTNAATAGGSLYSIATPTSKVPGAVGTKFTFLSPTPTNPLQVLAALGPLNASFLFNATATPGHGATTAGGYDIQPFVSGSFKFTYTGVTPLVVGSTTYTTGANLLTAVFSGSSFAGKVNSTAGSEEGSSTTGDTITYTSDFLTFINGNEQDFSMSLSAITPALSVTKSVLRTFNGVSTGSFSTDPQPMVTGDLPEPATWGLLVVGFGLVGLQGRRRSRSTSVAA